MRMKEPLVAQRLPGGNDPVGTRTRDLRINLPHGLSPATIVAVWTLPSPARGAARQVSEEPLAGFLLIAQSAGLSRSRVPAALRGFQHMVRFYHRPRDRGTPIEVRCSTN